MKKWLYWILIIILSAVILVCGFLIGRYLLNSRQAQKQNDHLSSLHTRPSEDPTQPSVGTPATPANPDDPAATDPSTEPTEPSMLPELVELYKINQDLVGWIKVDGTNIDYPVVQSPYEQNYYLFKDFVTHKFSDWGTIFVRETCDVNRPSDNVTIYGHRMYDGTRFAQLLKYREKSFWEQNQFVNFDTLTERHVYQIFAVFVTSATAGKGFAYHLFEDAANAAEYDAFVATCKELSFYDTGITPQYGEKLITLSTCEKSVENGRLVVVCRRVA